MCYSAQVEEDYKKFVRMYGAVMDFKTFHETYVERLRDGVRLQIPTAMDANFMEPQSPIEQEIKDAIFAFRAKRQTELEQEIEEQNGRLAAAEAKLAVKLTKKYENEKRVAGNRIARAQEKIKALNEPPPPPGSNRIYPLDFAAVMVKENGKRVIKPMRYHCRPAGYGTRIDADYPGLYNARRDSLEGWWKGMFGKSHGVLIATGFYENVRRPPADGSMPDPRDQGPNIILKFEPRTKQVMYLAALWDRTGDEKTGSFLSFAVITDEPPNEVRAAGHDRCIIPLKEKNVDAWLTPEGRSRKELYDILDDRERPYFEHQVVT
jgi:putative SOS response-associated peptidase YedK